MTFEEEVMEASENRTDIQLADRMTPYWTAYGNLHWRVMAGGVAPGGPLDPVFTGVNDAGTWTVTDTGKKQNDRDDSAWRTLTTVNSDDFSPKPTPKTFEAD